MQSSTLKLSNPVRVELRNFFPLAKTELERGALAVATLSERTFEAFHLVTS